MFTTALRVPRPDWILRCAFLLAPDLRQSAPHLPPQGIRSARRQAPLGVKRLHSQSTSTPELHNHTELRKHCLAYLPDLPRAPGLHTNNTQGKQVTPQAELQTTGFTAGPRALPLV